jgi:hypothetical protein
MSKNKHNSNLGSEIERSDDRINETGEVFTPVELVQYILEQFPKEMLQDPNSTFLDNSAGNGNLLLALKEVLLEYHSEEHIVNNMLYAVEFMEDNHKELCQRIGVSADHPHYVNADALEYHYQFNGAPVQMTLDQFF